MMKQLSYDESEILKGMIRQSLLEERLKQVLKKFEGRPIEELKENEREIILQVRKDLDKYGF